MSKTAYLSLAAFVVLAPLACSANSANQSDELDDSGSGGSGTGGNGSGAGAGKGGIFNPCGAMGCIVPQSCGDGNLNPEQGEECDDGNKTGMDGCSEACRREADYECPTPGVLCTNTAACGNGILNSRELCDDGNALPDDGCSPDCMGVTPGWQCRVAGKPCVPICGDGQMLGTERCDDGNLNNMDGCSVACLIEPGASCTGSPSVCMQAICGNGTMEAGEGCDAGADNGLFLGNGTGCSKTCTKEPDCRPGGVTQACAAVCGDANVDTTAGEQCDDGNAVPGDGCSETCQLETGFTCTDMEVADTQPCSTGAGNCLVLPITFRDFDGQNQPMGHPDFFFLGGSNTCVPNASGRTVGTNGTCWDSDSTPLCKGIAGATLGPDGKPVLGATSQCACRFTDWDGTGLVPNTNNCNDSNGGGHPRIETMVRVVTSADSFREWYADSTKSQKVVSTLELSQVNLDYQFSSSGGRTVYEDIHDIFMGTAIPATNAAVANSLSSGFFPLEMQTGLGATKLCNLWPYWTVGTGPCVANDGNPVWQQWDPRGSYTAMMEGEGGPVKPVTGNPRNFYFTSEIRYLFRYGGSGSLAFYGDDDVWVYINGHLALDLGAPHERLQGTVTMNGAMATWSILTTDITGAAVPPATGGTGTIDLGLETGKTYEIVVYHADRHPRESNYQLTLSAFPTSKTGCNPRCGDGVRTASEECDLGDGVNMAPELAYNGCTTDCKWGPFCGDGNVDMAAGEECDLGSMNTSTYGAMGCAPDCTKPAFCGDGIIDAAFGESCDDGMANGSATGTCDLACTLIAS